MNLRPEAELADLIAWISTVTCKPFVLPGHLSAAGKKITVVAPNLMTRDEAYAAFLNTLDSIGLTIEKGSGYLRIIETAKAKSSAVPVYGFDGQPVKSANE
jgi:general secretion pathway protein D